jgi:hypothetical protein
MVSSESEYITMASQETTSHTEIEQQNVERIESAESIDADEFSALLLSALRDDPNTEVSLEVAA